VSIERRHLHSQCKGTCAGMIEDLNVLDWLNERV
jgi:hypothetical protein